MTHPARHAVGPHWTRATRGLTGVLLLAAALGGTKPLQSPRGPAESRAATPFFGAGSPFMAPTAALSFPFPHAPGTAPDATAREFDPFPEGFGAGQLQPPPTWHEFYFTRAAYSSGGGWGRRSNAWATDFPKSDRQFLTVLKRLTNLDAFAFENAVTLTDPKIRRYPFLYALEVGYMNLAEAEIEGLRNYLLAGGTLIVDDFWGSREWAVFEWNMNRVLPGRPIVELEPDHPIFSTFYEIDEILQVPAYGRFRGGPTWERDGYVPHVRGIANDEGRLMVIVNWNTDLGDAWEWAEQPDYPLQYSTFAFQMGVNMIIYAMSH